jgi:protein SCO1
MKSKIYRMVFALLLIMHPGAMGEYQSPPKIGIEEKLGQMIPLDDTLHDETGQRVTLRSLIDKPTIITFVYFHCPGICTPLLNEMAKVVGKLDLRLGNDYQVLSISIDPKDTPEVAAGKKTSYLQMIDKYEDPKGWRFLTGDSVSIGRITSGAGFYFVAAGNDFTHPTALIVLGPDGKITRYINGYQYLPLDITMAISEASKGDAEPTIAKVMNFCFSYNPRGHSYSLKFMRIALVGSLGMAGLFVYLFIIRYKAKHPGK